MKQRNSVIASLLVSGLLVFSMLGIGANALANPSGAPASTTKTGAALNLGTRTREGSERHSTRSSTFSSDDEIHFSQ